MRISDWSSDVCSSDLIDEVQERHRNLMTQRPGIQPGVLTTKPNQAGNTAFVHPDLVRGTLREGVNVLRSITDPFSRALVVHFLLVDVRSEEHTSELQSLMRISYAVFCLKKK